MKVIHRPRVGFKGVSDRPSAVRGCGMSWAAMCESGFRTLSEATTLHCNVQDVNPEVICLNER